MKASAQIVELPRPAPKSRCDLVITSGAQAPQRESSSRGPGVDEVWSLIERASMQRESCQVENPVEVLREAGKARDSAAPGSLPAGKGSIARPHPNGPRAAARPLFEKLFRSFRVKLFDAVGPRYDELVREAERKVRFLEPDFDLDDLTGESAPATLDLIEEIIRRSPILKRSKLRKTASILLADLYEKHYDLVEKSGVLNKVEESYYRLKR